MPSALKCRRCGGVLSRPVSADDRPLLCFDCQAALARADGERQARIRDREGAVAAWLFAHKLTTNEQHGMAAARDLIAALGLPDPE